MDSRGLGPVDEGTNPFKGSSRIVDLKGHRKQCLGVAWSGDGRKLASASADSSVRVWQLENRSFNFRKSQELTGHKGGAVQVSWDPSHHDKVASVSDDGYVKIWDTRSGQCAQTLSLGSDGCLNVAYKPDGVHLAVGDTKDVIHFVDSRKFKVINTRSWPGEANQFMWNRAGTLFLVVTGFGSIDVFSYPSLAQADSLSAHLGSVFTLAGDRAGKHMAAGGDDGLVSIWDLEEMICVRTITEPENPIRGVDFSPNGEFIVTAADKSLLVSEVDTAKAIYKVPGINSNLSQSVAWHPSENLIAYSAADESVVHVFGFSGQGGPHEARVERVESRPDVRTDYPYPPRHSYNMGYGRPNYF